MLSSFTLKVSRRLGCVCNDYSWDSADFPRRLALSVRAYKERFWDCLHIVSSTVNMSRKVTIIDHCPKKSKCFTLLADSASSYTKLHSCKTYIWCSTSFLFLKDSGLLPASWRIQRRKLLQHSSNFSSGPSLSYIPVDNCKSSALRASFEPFYKGCKRSFQRNTHQSLPGLNKEFGSRCRLKLDSRQVTGAKYCITPSPWRWGTTSNHTAL